MRRPIVLIGLPGAGKTTAAPHAARLLQAGWCDLDARIESGAGASIPEIFAQRGEPRFRELEHAAMRRALDEEPQVIAAGAGWAAEPGNLQSIANRALVIYMSLTAGEAASRLRGHRGRPLLDDQDIEARVTQLLAAREPWYRLADIEIAVGESPPDAVAEGIVTAARQYGGW